MKNSLRRIVGRTLLSVAGLMLAVVGVLILPLYGAFMVVWIHDPLTSVLVTVGPISMLFVVGAYVALRASWRACSGCT